MRIAKGCLWLSLGLALVSGQPASGAAINYNLVSGTVTAVTIDFDQTNRLTNGPLSLDAGQVSVDFDALLLDILAVSAAGPGVVQLDGVNGWDRVTFSDASFASTQSSSLTAPPPGNPGNYDYGVPVQVIAQLVLDPSAPGQLDVETPFSALSNAAGTIIALNGNETLRITINGVVLGYLPDPTDPEAPLVLVKADFDFIAAKAPEPSAGVLALLGIAAALWRRRIA